ncbi:MAG TPA: crosslink repair DNA glycosylase YcaQ family protein [Microlunatus sp.]|nr:crosslink repair DNA glycosylase YcaQ family protein [Microlunatus sp.]
MELSLAEARRLALVAQGFRRRPAQPGLGEVRRTAARVLAIQLDSVSVLVRSHYLPAFSRLGPYPRESLDRLAYRRKELFECWSHAACLLPVELFPLLRHRMNLMLEAPTYSLGAPIRDQAWIEDVHREVADRGPLTAAELSTADRGSGTWWGWSTTKRALEALVECGRLAIAGRRGFTRVYDLVERVIPEPYLSAPAPPAEPAQKELLYRSAVALGIGTGRGLRDYLGLTSFRIRQPDGRTLRMPLRRLLDELVEEGRLVRATVEGWKDPGYLPAGSRIPRALHARALLSPFDSFVRASAKLCCGFTNPLAQQLYVPAERRVFGYYVLPFLLGDTLVGRCDLKADTKRHVLLVQAAHTEPGQDRGPVAAELAEELRLLARWLELDGIEVADRGDLARPLRRAGGFRPPRVDGG